MWKYAHLALTTITQLYLTFVTFLKYYQFIYIINNVISSLFKCYRCTYITYLMFLNKDINNHKQNFLNYFVGFFPVKLPIVMVVTQSCNQYIIDLVLQYCFCNNADYNGTCQPDTVMLYNVVHLISNYNAG